MKLTLGFSPCPNDTFIFDALVNRKIDTGELELEPVLEDVETLNEWALEGKLDITKLSFPAFFRSLDQYVLLNAGGALGKGAGPLLITNNEQARLPDGQGIKNEEVKNHQIVLPGINTTANLLFSFAFPEAKKKKFMVFSAIEDAVASGENDLGVIIHENRFTYQQKGLYKVADLGEVWEERMKLPIPLGGIAVKRNISRDLSQHIETLIRKSLEYSFCNYPVIPEYVKQHSQTMSEDVMRKHIDLYVNNYSLDMGEEGRRAVQSLYNVFCSINNTENFTDTVLFL